MQTVAQQQLVDFLKQLEVEQRVSIHTLKSYQRDLKYLVGFCVTKSITFCDPETRYYGGFCLTNNAQFAIIYA